MRLRAVYNKTFEQAKICHDGWCKPGETSVVAMITPRSNEEKDMELARKICERWNMVEDALGRQT